MFAGRADADAPAFNILQAQPRHRAKQRFRAPATREHRTPFGVRIKEADFESFSAHSATLLLDSFDGIDGRHLFFRFDRLCPEA